MSVAIIIQVLQTILLISLAPMLLGWIRQNRAWVHNKKGAGVLQPYYGLRKLFIKESVLAPNASLLFRAAPYVYFACMCLVTLIVPILYIPLPFMHAADVIALVGIFALSRVFMALAAMDVGTAFGSLGARREMMVAFLAEPALLIVFFNIAIINNSTVLSTIVHHLISQPFILYPSIIFAATAFILVLLAENGRIPVDNPTTHLELTMIHEAMILEYSGRHLALIEWGSALKLLNYFAIGFALFIPWGIASSMTLTVLSMALLLFIIKLSIASCGLVLIETITAKIRLFRVPEFLMSAFVLAVLGLMLNTLLWR